ncbi:MAG: hypothetical protein JNL75_08780 [Chitinophagales bacterium]|nr:hypothetical protein [Chitinophagales bacterium]
MKGVLVGMCLILFTCGKKEDPVILYCGVKDPVNELEWLRIAIKDRKTSSDSILVQKMEMPSIAEKGFLFQFEAKGFGGSLPHQKYYYSCGGTLICYNLGGVTGTNCGNKLNDIKLGDIVYKSY